MLSAAGACYTDLHETAIGAAAPQRQPLQPGLQLLLVVNRMSAQPMSWQPGSAVRGGAQRLFTLLQAATAASTAQYVGFSAMLFMLVRQGRLDLRDLGSMPSLAEVVPFAKVSARPLRLFGVATAEGMASPAVQRPWFVTCGCCKCVPCGRNQMGRHSGGTLRSSGQCCVKVKVKTVLPVAEASDLFRSTARCSRRVGSCTCKAALLALCNVPSTVSSVPWPHQALLSGVPGPLAGPRATLPATMSSMPPAIKAIPLAKVLWCGALFHGGAEAILLGQGAAVVAEQHHGDASVRVWLFCHTPADRGQRISHTLGPASAASFINLASCKGMDRAPLLDSVEHTERPDRCSEAFAAFCLLVRFVVSKAWQNSEPSCLTVKPVCLLQAGLGLAFCIGAVMCSVIGATTIATGGTHAVAWQLSGRAVLLKCLSSACAQ